MNRQYQAIDWPEYFVRVADKQARKARRKEFYRFLRFMTMVASALFLIVWWPWR